MNKVSEKYILFENKGRKASFLVLTAIMFLNCMLLPSAKSFAATPPAGTLNGDNTTTPARVNGNLWVGDKPGGAAPNAEADCADTALGVPSTVCDTFKLTLTGVFTNKRARIQINWLSPTTDYDLYIHKDSPEGTLVATSASGTTTFEQADIDPSSSGLGDYYIRVVYFAATAADQYKGSATVVSVPPPFVPPTNSFCSITPTYQTDKPPAGLRGFDTAGEPSIGVNWNTGNVLFQSGFATLRATYNDSTSPATPIWASTRPTNAVSLDPIMFTDSVTGRTIPGQLLTATSKTAITDNDGDTYTDTTSGLDSGVDHQSIGGGPYKKGILDANNTLIGPTTNYPRAVYYSSQGIAASYTARSDDGGLTFGPEIPMYTLAQCSGLHGHVKVAPDGTVYVPNKNCPDPDVNAATADGGQGVAVSEDNGLTWSVRTVPGSGSGDNDPSVGIGAGGRVYFAYTAGDKKIRAAVSDDHGLTWKYDQDIGLPFNIRASVFPAAIAGDNNRATIFFHGTSSTDPHDPTGTDNGPTTGADPDLTDNFSGVWYTYMATTCDGGKSWSVVRVGDPVQIGVICTNGTTCPGGDGGSSPDTRNLLDFMDLTVDRFGRAVGGYADGCVTAGCVAMTDKNGDGKLTKEDNDGFSYATIIRQTGGSRLFADFDPNGPSAPTLPPPVSVASSQKGNNLSWQTPDNGGSPLISYRVYRGTGDKAPTLIGQVSAGNHTFRDRRQTFSRNGVYYQVTAVNVYGESPRTVKYYSSESKTTSKKAE